MAAFSAADKGGEGMLPFGAMRSCLEGCDLRLSANEVMGLLSMMSDTTPYADIATMAFKILRAIAAHGGVM
eukprot:4238496-Prymnesium_polylepis.1